MAVTALVFGIVGLVMSVLGSWFLVGGIIGIILSVVAIILGALASKRNDAQKGKAKAGLILGIIGAALGIILVIACTACYSDPSVQRALNDALNY